MTPDRTGATTPHVTPGRRMVVIGAVLVGAAVAVYLLARSHWQVRLPPGWTWGATFVGIATPPDPQSGEFPQRDVTAVYVRQQRISNEGRRPDWVEVTDTYLNLDPRTGRKIYDYVRTARIDPRTGQHAVGHPGDIFVFPRNVERRTYRVRNSYLTGTPFQFQGTEAVEGVETYVFGYAGAMEYSEFYAGTPELPGIRLPPGQDIRCLYDKYEQTLWVEPVTGEILKYAEACRSWDAIVERRTGRPLRNVLRWSGETAGDDVTDRVEQVLRTRAKMQATLWLLPTLLALAGLGLAVAGLRRRMAP